MNADQKDVMAWLSRMRDVTPLGSRDEACIDYLTRALPSSAQSVRLQSAGKVGLKLVGAENERLQSFGVWMDGGSLQVWVSVRGSDIEVMQYLTPGEAMAFAKAFERCAIAALKAQA